MRRMFYFLLLGIYWFSAGTGLVRADGMILPEVLSPDYLVVRYHHVAVDIEDGHAVTRVEQEFYNPHPFAVKGRYLFPVPPDAILSRFRAMVDGRHQTVERQEPAVTNATLYEMVTQRHEPSLLQYADWETLAFDLNLPVGGSRRMSLEYEEVLAPSGGLYHYRYVLSTERYSSQPLEQVSLTVDLHASSGLSTLYSPSHSVSTERLGINWARATWEAEHVRPSEDFELFFAPAEGGFGGGLLTGRRMGHDHFLFFFAPEADASQIDVIPKDIVFLIDRSRSMSGEKMEQARNALHFILGQLNTDDRFSIVGFDHRLTILSPTLQSINREALGDARRFVDQLGAEGNTDLEAALQAGLAILRQSATRDASRLVVFLTDGLPTAGVLDEGLIARLVTETNGSMAARLHVFGVGYDVNTHLLDRLAADNGGAVTYVQPGENLESVLMAFYERIAYPVLTDLGIEFEGVAVSELYPKALPDLFRGSSLLLTGRFEPTTPKATIRVRGRAGGEWREFVYRFDLEQASVASSEGHENGFVPRLWATRRVGELLDRVRVEGESPTLVGEIRELGLGYGLVTPYTTFVIQAQIEGAASAANMALYANPFELNQAWGQTTVQARVQNQLYQQAAQADLASGANVVNSGQHSLAQVDDQSVDLALLQGASTSEWSRADLAPAPVTLEWVERNVGIDRSVAFGSADYFALAGDPETRSFLQSGTNVVFKYQGEVISVQDATLPETGPLTSDSPAPVAKVAVETRAWLRHLLGWLIRAVEVWLKL